MSSLIRVSVLLLFLGMKSTQYFHHVAEKSVGRTKNMEPVRLGKKIQPGRELWKIINQNNVEDARHPSEDFQIN